MSLRNTTPAPPKMVDQVPAPVEEEKSAEEVSLTETAGVPPAAEEQQAAFEQAEQEAVAKATQAAVTQEATKPAAPATDVKPKTGNFKAAAMRIRDPVTGTMYTTEARGVTGQRSHWVESQLRAGVLIEV